MTFWTDQGLEPKRNYKFLLSIPGGTAGTGIQQYLIKSAGKPTFDVTSSPHDFLNHKFYYPGRTTWNPISVVIVDAVNSDINATQSVMKILEASGYKLPTDPQSVEGRQTISKNKATNVALGRITLRTLNAEGATVEEWVLNNAFITKAEFSGFDYSSEELQTVTLTLQYDNAYVNVILGDGPIPTNASA